MPHEPCAFECFLDESERRRSIQIKQEFAFKAMFSMSNDAFDHYNARQTNCSVFGLNTKKWLPNKHNRLYNWIMWKATGKNNHCIGIISYG